MGPNEDEDEDGLGIGAWRGRPWVRALATALVALLCLSTIGTVSLVLLRRTAQVRCDTTALAGLDLVGVSVGDARRMLERGQYRCEHNTTVAVAVADFVACDRDRPGTIVSSSRLEYDAEGDPVLEVVVCSSVSSA